MADRILIEADADLWRRTGVARPACSGACNQGRDPCPCPEACEQPSAEREATERAVFWWAKDLDAIADTILADVRVKRGTTKWSEGYIEAPLVYLRGRRWEDGVEPDGGNPGEAVAPWHDSVKGVVAKGIELGVGGWTQTEWEAGKAPAYPAYRARVLRAAGVEPRRAA